MQWVILLYAFLEYPDGSLEKVVSRNLPFQTYNQCEQFYYQNKDNLIPGVIDYSKTYNGEKLNLIEMGCSKAEVVKPGQPIPEPTGFKPLYRLGTNT
tara:strand:+ start:6895 stop:7185 length:291 start_codon:yes stop_codon:yes gene_type:complete